MDHGILFMATGASGLCLFLLNFSFLRQLHRLTPRHLCGYSQSIVERVLCPCDPVTPGQLSAPCPTFPGGINSSSPSRRDLCTEEEKKSHKHNSFFFFFLVILPGLSPSGSCGPSELPSFAQTMAKETKAKVLSKSGPIQLTLISLMDCHCHSAAPLLPPFWKFLRCICPLTEEG